MSDEVNSQNFETKLLGVASILAGLVSNPLVMVRLFFANSPRAPFRMSLFLWMVDVLLIAFGVLLLRQKLKVKALFGNVLLLFFTCVALLYFTTLADRLYGKFVNKDEASLIFPPRFEMTYDTGEFNVVAKVNSLGFRDNEYPIAKGSNYRIVAIGDSFTFGWGVNIEDAWTKILEKKLTQEDASIEVLNLGQSGAHPAMYAKTAQKAIPLLTPDLVVVAILQGDDLFQTIEMINKANALAKASQAEPSLLGAIVSLIKSRLLPNILRNPVSFPGTRNMVKNWKASAHSIYEKSTAEQKGRIDKIDRLAMTNFFSGKLSPALLQITATFPDYFARYDDTAKPEVQEGIQKMAESLMEIREVTGRHGGEVVVVSVPYRAYICMQEIAALRKLGQNISDSLAGSTGADAAIKLAADKAGLKFYEFTAQFRAACDSAPLYYPQDGHFTKAGNELFADLLASALRAYMPRRRSPSHPGRSFASPKVIE